MGASLVAPGVEVEHNDTFCPMVRMDEKIEKINN